MDCAVETTDRMLSMNLLMGVESNSGAADAGASVTWPGAEVAAKLSPPPDRSPKFADPNMADVSPYFKRSMACYDKQHVCTCLQPFSHYTNQ